MGTSNGTGFVTGDPLGNSRLGVGTGSGYLIRLGRGIRINGLSLGISNDTGVIIGRLGASGLRYDVGNSNAVGLGTKGTRRTSCDVAASNRVVTFKITIPRIGYGVANGNSTRVRPASGLGTAVMNGKGVHCGNPATMRRGIVNGKAIRRMGWGAGQRGGD